MSPKICYYDNGKIWSKSWYKDDKRHRENDKPAYISYYDNGKISYESWYKDDKLHRENDKPAYISYYNGKISYEYWYKDNKRHRGNDKPAVIWYNNGKILSEEWYLNGEEYSKDEYLKLIKLAKEIKKDLTLAILYIRHKSNYIKSICQEVINES